MTNQHNAKQHLLAMANNYAQLAVNAQRLQLEAMEENDIGAINYWVNIQEECQAKSRGLLYRAKRLA
jgi:hypothetical protein